MEIQMNEGYIIIDSIYIGGSGFVLGVSSSIPNMYVTWEHINGKYYNGRYTGSMLSEKRDLLSRATNALERMERKKQQKQGNEPEFTPWGEISECCELSPGIFSVSTPSHGGIMAEASIAKKIFSKEAAACGFQENGYICFEEDCAATVAIRELMDRGIYQAPVNEYYNAGEYSSMIDDSIRRYYPDYWRKREKQLSKGSNVIPTKKKNNKERER